VGFLKLIGFCAPQPNLHPFTRNKCERESYSVPRDPGDMSSDMGAGETIDLRHSNEIVSVSIIYILAIAGDRSDAAEGIKVRKAGAVAVDNQLNAWDTCLPERMANNCQDKPGRGYRVQTELWRSRSLSNSLRAPKIK
jgi:hypothetical protein